MSNRPTHRSYAIYGKSGTGKTTLAGTFPTPSLLVDIRDKGSDSISDLKDIDLIQIDEMDDPGEAWNRIQEVVSFLKVTKGGKYKTVIFDTITQATQCAVEYVLVNANRMVDNAGDWGTMKRKDWGEVASLMKILITDLRDLPMEVVFLAQERIFNDSDDDEDELMLSPEVGPRLSPSVKDHICAETSVIGNTFIRKRVVTKKVKGKKVRTYKTEYGLRIGPDDVYITKVRKPRANILPDVIIDPTFDTIQRILRGE